MLLAIATVAVVTAYPAMAWAGLGAFLRTAAARRTLVFIAGRQDWGVFQAPGALERMQTVACTRMTGCHILEGAGHWVQQERPQEAALPFQPRPERNGLIRS